MTTTAQSSDPAADPAEVGEPEDEQPVSDRTTLVIGAVMALVAIALVGVLIATGDGDSGGGGGDGGGDARPVAAIFGTVDEFEREGEEELGSLTTDRDWESFSGVWGIDDGNAYVVTSDEFRNHVAIGLGQGDGAVQVRVERVTAGAGIIFRFRGPFNYWAVVAAPNSSTWNLIRIEDSEFTFVGNTGPSPVADGTTIAARFEGERIEVIINGTVKLTAQDNFLADEGKVGLTVRGEDATEARFDNFVAALPGNRPLFVGDGSGQPDDATSPSTTTTTDGG